MQRLPKLIGWLFALVFLVLVNTVLLVSMWLRPGWFRPAPTPPVSHWQAPDTLSIPSNEAGAEIRYGQALIRHTSYYLGPEGTVQSITNGMDCENCHLDGGTRTFGNNFGSVASLYPKFRPRSGSMESIEKRINDCLIRSLNGAPLDSLSKEMRAMVAYINWLGQDVERGKKASGSGLAELKFLDRAADPVAGLQVYHLTCMRCHGSDGQGTRGRYNYFEYPPLWGPRSFNTGAGLYRISNMARYIYTNMPYGIVYEHPELSPEDAWDVAAYIVSMPRPQKDFYKDWPDRSQKPVDYPFGPYTDAFPESQHKYGPFPPILATKPNTVK